MKKIKGILSTILSLVILMTCVFTVSATGLKEDEKHMESQDIKTVSVRDFGAIPNDNKDDSAEIQKAIDYAIENNINVISFEAGEYNFFINPIGGQMENAYLKVINGKNITLSGAKSDDGKPSTVFMRHNPGGDSVDLKQLLYVADTDGFTMKNIAFDIDELYYTACEIESVKGDTVNLTVAEGFPIPSKLNYTKYNLPGLYNKSTKTFFEQRLTWSLEDGSDAESFIVPNESEPQNIQIKNKTVADRVKNALKKNEKDDLLLFFFQGHHPECAKMVYIRGTEDVLVENCHIFNGTGFPLTCDFCRNVTYKNVKAEPHEGHCAVAPRDCFKLYCCSGDITLDGVTMDGFEDDGQNCHGMFSTVNKIVDDYTIVANLTQVLDNRPEWLIDTEIRFLKPNSNELSGRAIIKEAKKIDDSHWQLKMVDKLPEGIVTTESGDFHGTTIFELGAYLAETWTVRNCTIRNTFRGLKISAQNVLVENNFFENNVYHIYMGAENDEWWHESQNPRNVVIRNNVFKNPLWGIAIDMDFHAYGDAENCPVIDTVEIYENEFINCNAGVSVKDAKNVYIYDNVKKGGLVTMLVDYKSSNNIYDVSPENSENKMQVNTKVKIVNITILCLIIVLSLGAAVGIGFLIYFIVKKFRKNK